MASCHTQVCCIQSPCPSGSHLLTVSSPGNAETHFCLSLCRVSESWCAWGIFESSEHFWRIWGLILNVISSLLRSCWGFSFILGCGVSPHSRLSSTQPLLQHLQIYMYVCKYVYVYIYVYMHVCECTWIYVHAHIYGCVSHSVLFKSIFEDHTGFPGCCPLLPHWDLSGYTGLMACLRASLSFTEPSTCLASHALEFYISLLQVFWTLTS